MSYMADEKKEITKDVRRIIPPVDIYETSNDIVLVADLPGVTKENLQLDIDNDELTIKGTFEEKNDNGKKLIGECVYGEYSRAFALADTIDKEEITAKLDNGVLTLTLPKAENVKPRKITIETE